MAQVVVVGAGFAGTSLAVRLAKLRHDVLVLEASSEVGGRLRPHPLSAETAPGTTTGWHLSPVTVTLPGVLRDLFRKSGRPLDAALSLHAAPGPMHVFADRTRLDLPLGRRSDQVDAMLEMFGADPWSPWLDAMSGSWDVIRRRLLNRVPTGDGDDLDREARRTLDVRRSLHREVRRTFKDDRLRRMALDPVRLAGDDPRLVPAAASVVHHVERNFGRWAVEGGPTALADALERRLQERSVEVRTGTAALDVVVAGGRVTGVRTVDGTVAADVVAWCAGTWPGSVREPSLLPRIPAHRTLVRLPLDAPLPAADLAVHADPPLRVWESAPGCWTIAHLNPEDPLVALARVGLDVREAVTERHDLRPRDLVRSGHWGWQWQTWRTVARRPGPHLPDGLLMAGAHAHPGGSVEEIGLATEALAERLGAVPRRPARGA